MDVLCMLSRKLAELDLLKREENKMSQFYDNIINNRVFMQWMPEEFRNNSLVESQRYDQ